MVRSGPQSKHVLRETVTMKEIIGSRCDKTGKSFWLESLNHPNLVNFKNICYQPLAMMFEYVPFSFSPLERIREIHRLDGFQRFLDYFSFKNMKLFFFRK